MTPPISIDGTDITGATIDGQDVQEITVDGQTVFTAGPPSTPPLANFSLTHNISSIVTGGGPEAIEFNDDGTKIFLTLGNDYIEEFNLSTPYDISTATQVRQISEYNSNQQCFKFNDDGTKAFISTTSAIREFSLPNTYDVRNANLQHTENIDAQGFNFNADGTVLVVGDTFSPLKTFSLSTPFDLSSISSTPTSTATIGDRIDGVAFSTSGDRLYTVNTISEKLEDRTMSTPFDLSTLSSVVTTISITGGRNGLDIDNEQSSLYVFEANNSLKQFDA